MSQVLIAIVDDEQPAARLTRKYPRSSSGSLALLTAMRRALIPQRKPWCVKITGASGAALGVDQYPQIQQIGTDCTVRPATAAKVRVFAI
jgi:hypothetical protein